MKKKSLITFTLVTASLLGLTGVSIAIGHTTSTKIAQLELGEQLGWTTTNNCLSLCCGYYQEPNIALLLPPGLATDQLYISADTGHYTLAGQSTIAGHVVIADSDKQVTADQAQFSNSHPQQKLINLSGHVVMRELGNTIIAKQVQYVWGRAQGDMHDVLYRRSLGTPQFTLSADKKHRLLYGLIGWGTAQKAEQQSKTIIVLHKTNFTTCSPEKPVWRLDASKLTLNRANGRGVARNMVLRVKDVPVLYTPYFNFPIDKRRQSGFLFGSYGYANQSGFDIFIPYYWNIAPNYDATIAPRIIQKRGVQLTSLFRYLTPTSRGSLNIEYLPGDKDFQTFKTNAENDYPHNSLLSNLLEASDDRYLLHWRNDTQLSESWSSHIDVTKVSDDYYFIDLGTNPNAMDDNQLLQQADLRYTGTHWNFLGRLQHVQTLHPINRAYIADQYSRLPQLLLTANYPQIGLGLDYTFSTEFVHFDRPRDPLTRFIYPTGNRVDVKPGLKLPVQRAWGFFIPRIQLEATHYDIVNAYANKANSIERIIPIASIDSGLFFARTTQLMGTNYKQTLEPRAFYLYVPYKNQTDIPIFDSAWQPLSFAQLFNWNRFTGIDRIGDTNQITLAVTSRFIEQASGIEKLRASIGQIYYFQNRKVTLNDPLLPVQNLVGEQSNTNQASPVIGELNYYIANNWHFILNGGYDVHDNEVYSTGANFQYTPGAGRFLNVGYSFMRKGDILPATTGLFATSQQIIDLKMVDASFAWPVFDKRWKLVGRWNYNLGQHHVQNIFSGIEYNTCCWAMRFIANKSFSAFNQVNNPEYNTGFYLQLQLKGLGNFSTSDPTNILLSGIPGYQDNFGEV